MEQYINQYRMIIDENNCLYTSSNFIGIDGQSVERTKDEYPYSYDTFVVWKNKDYDKSKGMWVYSDRLYQWDYKKYNDCCKQIWNNESQYFDDRNPKDIEKFLSKYFDKFIKLTMIAEGCNCSNGFPIWLFCYE